MLRSLKQVLDIRYFRNRGLQSIEIEPKKVVLSKYHYKGKWLGTQDSIEVDDNLVVGEGDYTNYIFEHLVDAPCVVMIPDHFLKRFNINKKAGSHTKLDASYINWLAEKRLGGASRAYTIMQSDSADREIRITAYPNSIVSFANGLQKKGVECLQVLSRSTLIAASADFVSQIILIADGSGWAILVVGDNGVIEYVRAHEMASNSTSYIEYIGRSVVQVVEYFVLKTSYASVAVYVTEKLQTGFEEAFNQISQHLFVYNNIDQLDYGRLLLNMMEKGKL